MRNLIFTWCDVILKQLNSEPIEIMSEWFLALVLLLSDLHYKEGLLCVARKLWGEVLTSGQEQETAAVPQRQELGLWTEWRLQGWILVQTGSLLGETLPLGGRVGTLSGSLAQVR